MSPEQARGETLDARSDLFSLGSVLYMLCTGRAAFAAGNTMAVLKRVCEETPRPIREVNPDIPEWLAEVVNRLLAKNPSERFQTAGELAGVLGQHLAQLQQSRQTQTPAPEKLEAVPPAAAPAEPGGRVAWNRKRVAVTTVLMVGVVTSLATVAVLSWPRLFPSPASDPERGTTVPDDPHVLTVSKRPEDKAQFNTIQAALDEVEPGMTIRVLDDSVYDEYLLINRNNEYRGVVLEATGEASLRRLPDKSEVILIRNVPGFTLRGFRFKSPPDNHPCAQIGIIGRCPGVVLDSLDMMSGGRDCVDLIEEAAGSNDAPIVIQNCTMRGGGHGITIEGIDRNDRDRPLRAGHMVIRDNTLLGCDQAVFLQGAVNKVLMVGNRIRDAKHGSFDWEDPLEGAADILVANNTMLRCVTAVRIFDDHSKGNGLLRAKNIRIQNNLVFQPYAPTDMVLLNHSRGEHVLHVIPPCEVKRLLDNPEWRFGYNWREVDPVYATAKEPDRFIPLRQTDHRLKPDMVLSRKPNNPNFLRPAKDSPLATGGAGVTDPSLPAYVGAVSPEGAEPWDWQKTWIALTH
jgi:hypothetical protein